MLHHAIPGLLAVLAALPGLPAQAQYVGQYGPRHSTTDVPKVQFFIPAPDAPTAPVIVPQVDTQSAAQPPTSPLTAPSAPVAIPAAPAPRPPAPPPLAPTPPAPTPSSPTPLAAPASATPRPQAAAPQAAAPQAAASQTASPSPQPATPYFVPGSRPAPVAATALATAAPAATAEAFYRTYLQLRTSGVPTAVQRARLRPFLTPALDAALAAAEQAEKTYKAKHNGTVPPLVEGDLFSSLFEGATAFIVQECVDRPPGMQCQLQLTHTNPTTNQKIEWRDTVLLIRLGNTWRISDIVYGGKFAFGQTGQLTDLLQIVMKEAKEAKE